MLLFQVSLTYANELSITGNINPAGVLSIESNQLFGHVVYNPTDSTYMSSYIFVPIKSLKSNIELRDEHIANYLSEKKIRNLVMTEMLAKEKIGRGKISVNGIEKKIDFTVKHSGANITSEFKLRLSDFKLKRPTFMGISLDDEILIKVVFEKKNIEVKK